jgi:hypothetical protein
MRNEDALLEILKRQKTELSQHPKLTSLSNLYSAVIQVRENQWNRENGLISKSTIPPVDFKPLIDAVAEENVRNGETREILKEKKADGCIDCIPPEVDVMIVKKDRLGNLTRDD